MLSEEEIEKAKKECNLAIKCIRSDIRCEDTEDNFILAESMETLLQYVDQLETDKSKLVHMLYDYITERKINIKMIDEMAKFILKITNREEFELNIEKEKIYFRKKIEEN